MNMTDAQRALEALLPSLNSHMPDIAPIITGFIPELRIITRRGLATSVDRIEADVSNLLTQLTEICAFAEDGFENEDVQIARRAMHTLALDLRRRTGALIKERTTLLRINAEVSAHRADPDLDPVDFTQEYRVLAAAPVTQFQRDGQVPRKFDLPAKGGKTGRIEGDFYAQRFNDPKRHACDVAPLDTFFLPAGRTIHIHERESIIVRCQGFSWNHNLSYDGFRETQTDLLIEGKTGSAVISGPATFSLHDGVMISELLNTVVNAHSLAADTVSEPMSMNDPRRGKILGEAVPFLLTVGAVFAIVLLPMAVAFENILILSPVGALLGAAVSLLATQYSKVKRFDKYKSVFCSLIKKTGAINAISEGHACFKFSIHSGIPDKADPKEAVKILAEVSSYFSHSPEAIAFYPVRQTIVRERQGVRVIEPLPALPAPSPEIDMGHPAVVRMRTSA